MMTTAALSLLVAVCATLAVRAGARRQVYVFKPLTVVLIILIALQSNSAAPAAYLRLVVAGLVCSLAGDVFLMLPRDRFVAGLGSFLFAHACYVAAFVSDGALAVWPVPLALLFGLYGATVLRELWPNLGRMKAPVVVYTLVILLMSWCATTRWVRTGEAGRMLAAAGAALFVMSDTALALNRFKGEFRDAPGFILSTYFAAQWLIALST